MWGEKGKNKSQTSPNPVIEGRVGTRGSSQNTAPAVWPWLCNRGLGRGEGGRCSVCPPGPCLRAVSLTSPFDCGFSWGCESPCRACGGFCIHFPEHCAQPRSAAAFCPLVCCGEHQALLTHPGTATRLGTRKQLPVCSVGNWGSDTV